MRYVYRENALNAMLIETGTASDMVYSGLDSVSRAAVEIVGRNDWEGNKAAAVKEYLTTLHGTVISSIALLMQSLYGKALCYQKGYKAIDSARETVISGQELNDLKTRLNEMAPVFDSLNKEAQKIVQSVAHIRSIPYACIDDLPRSMSDLAQKFEDLDGEINDHENKYQEKFAAEIDMIARITAMINEARGMELNSFSAQTLVKSSNFQNLLVSYKALQEALAARADEIEAAEALFRETYKQLEKEYQERIEKAQSAKFWTGILTACAAAVIITVSGGTATVVILAGVGSGMINAGVASYYDQQIGTVGYPGSLDLGKFAMDVTVGGMIGGVTSSIGLGFGEAASEFSTMGQIGWEGMKTVSVGVVERGGNQFYESISSGKSFSESMSDTFTVMYDPNKMLGDFAGGVTGKAFSIGYDKVSGKFESKVFGNKSTIPAYENSIQVSKAKSPYLHQAYDIGSETVKETEKGIVKRFAGTYAETRDVKESWGRATDSRAILTDAATTATTKTATTVTSDIKTKMAEKTSQAQQKIDQVQEQINEDTLKYNNGSETGKGGNRNVCEKLGISRNEVGTPDYKGSEHMAAETEIEGVVADPTKVKDTKAASSRQDYKNAYDQMVAEKKIDPKEYKWDDGNVIRTQKVTVNGKTTTVETEYTVHHVEYDVNTGKTRFQLVETEYHKGVRHQGGASQADNAYNKYHVGEYINTYNDAVRDANDLAGKSYENAKHANLGGKSGSTVSETPEYVAAEAAPGTSLKWDLFSLPALGGG